MKPDQQETKNFKFELVHMDRHCRARAGVLHTPHGSIETPVFMPVATHGAIKALQPKELKDLSFQVLLSNTYHLHLSPGAELIAKAGGLHKFMGWDRAILTDSGGFQVFSLQKNSITDEGANFKGPDGENIFLSPEKSIEIQQLLGSDIMMAFDECIPFPTTEGYVQKSLKRTHSWLKRCVEAWTNKNQALFGIVQGGTYKKYRKLSIDAVTDFKLPGYAIGGVSIGEGKELIREVVEYTAPLLPEDKPRYLMGVGMPEDLFMLWENGVDMSDCTIPTKFGRNGTLFTNRGKIRIDHKSYRRDFFPIEPNLKDYVNSTFTRAYLKHLFDSNEMLGQILATAHNLAFYKSLAVRAREAILEDRFLDFKRDFLAGYRQ
ncbi:MAG: tRNA guanosine(34) transglycosylase Tgt [Oligoflexia bacterium]|nr:tRNA guanosine(34) transglycosylase Tgt [Oligoflexia bacterium]